MNISEQRGQKRRGVWRSTKLLGRTIWTAYNRFGHTGTPLMAAAIAFYAIICLGPIGILMSALLQILFGEGSNTYQWLTDTVAEYGDVAAQQVMSQVDGLLAQPDLFTTSALSVVALVWASLRLFETIERSMTQIWPGTILRGFLGRKLVALVMMGLAGTLLTGFVIANAFFARLHGVLRQFPEIDADAVMQAQPRIMSIVGLLLALVAFNLLYRHMPVQKVPRRAALAGAVCAAVLWQAASRVFLYFISHSAHNNAIYGGLAGVVVFSLWAFLGGQILLFGAHFAAAFQEMFLGEKQSGSTPEQPDATQK